jgi:hypothetical protein
VTDLTPEQRAVLDDLVGGRISSSPKVRDAVSAALARSESPSPEGLTEAAGAVSDTLADWAASGHGPHMDVMDDEGAAFLAAIKDMRAALRGATPGDGLARALHDQRAARSLAGCGWVFGSSVDGEPLCPCPADADDLRARLAATEQGEPTHD